ncbi:MAG TPA: magnesium/cobalt transporter CorA [Kofleriaceae bacterium]|nr:magnesium/cobalt transporter CorA [Kofleriaceae bacterium]
MLARIYQDDQVKTVRDVAEIRAAIDAKLPIWIELESQCDEGEQLMLEVFNIHPLTVEDIWQVRAAPKLEDYRNYLYVIVHGVHSVKRGQIDLIELDVIIGKTFVITHDPTGETTKDVVDELERDPSLLCKGPAWLAHAILDNAVDRYLPIVDQLDEDIEKLEMAALLKAGTPKGPAVLTRILQYRRLLQDLRRMSIHQREILLRLARGEFDEIPREVVPFFRDVFDHFVRINDLLDGFRDLITSALEAYLGVQNNRMGEVMKTLTLISTVMLPLTFVVGLYGMNFKHMPELNWLYGYPLALALMGTIAFGILWWFRRKGWIGSTDLPEERPRGTTRKAKSVVAKPATAKPAPAKSAAAKPAAKSEPSSD